jgi:hypothetical protein
MRDRNLVQTSGLQDGTGLFFNSTDQNSTGQRVELPKPAFKISPLALIRHKLERAPIAMPPGCVHGRVHALKSSYENAA